MRLQIFCWVNAASSDPRLQSLSGKGNWVGDYFKKQQRILEGCLGKGNRVADYFKKQQRILEGCLGRDLTFCYLSYLVIQLQDEDSQGFTSLSFILYCLLHIYW
ncbi:uncharacterized protein LOC126709728 [Quercus robur]|uniref:uncharacterized protein LOC126709728 n=1 Tax=Quercus robur TaxID=38942 RepID=UPI002163A536|nr:uncharacterized protein LOC126709728 [Quercus robur]